MSEGVIIVIVMVSLFGFCYFYSYGLEYLNRKRSERNIKKKQQARIMKDEQLKTEMAARQTARDEMYKAARERSKEIKRELKRLKQLRLEA